MPLRPHLPAALLLSLSACGGAPPGGKPGGDGAGGAGGGAGAGGDGGPPTDTGVERIPGRVAPWEREEVEAPGPVGFTELHPHPPAGEPEWVELHNPLVLDIDLSGWRLSGGITYVFPEGTVLAAGGYLVVAADPGGLPGVGALGPFDGALADRGERIELLSNGGRRIDSVRYGDDDPWPAAASGTGLTLAKRRADSASDRAEGWTSSAAVGGTPGAPNGVDPDAPPLAVPLIARAGAWRYDASGAPAAGWTSPAFDDAGWAVGDAIFFGGDAGPLEGTLWITADNYYSVYIGGPDGSDLALVAEDPDGDWTSVDPHELWLAPSDHLYIAAWEAPGDAGGPQMLIAQVDLPDAIFGTRADALEWSLGPPGGSPGAAPPAAAPDEATVSAQIAAAGAEGAWSAPAAEAPRSADPWGWAVQAAFDDEARFVWADTFSDVSVTNVDETYALFRSTEPLASLRGGTDVGEIPVMAAFRAEFTVDADPADVELLLSCVLDDGAAVHLNGVEVLRHNLPAGPLGPSTVAVAAVAEADEVAAVIPGAALVRGRNVLAAQLHQARAADDDLAFGCALTARISADALPPALSLHEIGAGGEGALLVELRAARPTGAQALELRSSAGAAVALPVPALSEGELSAVEVNLDIPPGELLWVWDPDGGAVIDAVRVSDRPRARDRGGAWRTPVELTPGDENLVEVEEDVVIHELHYHSAPISQEGRPVAETDEEWLELYNRGDAAIDLSGWQLVDAVAYAFPSGTTLEPGGHLVVARDAAALRAAHPDIAVVGDFSGRLGNAGDRVLLLDAAGNPADELRYHDGGRWPAAADGGGSTLELRDPWADNAAAEAWAASATDAGWNTYRYRGLAAPSAVGPDGLWNELVIGLLDAGELLIDDLRVVQDPDGAALDLLDGGGFEDIAAWRMLGTHRRSEVVPDPDDPSNPVLRLVATGPTEHMHNHAEVTLRHPITDAEHEISFRARWVSGSNQLHTRLYFHRLARATRVERPERAGTPGRPNRAGVANIGPTFGPLRQGVAVPAPGEPVPITVAIADPDGVAAVTLWTREDGGVFSGAPMREISSGLYLGEVEGRPAGALVQLYVEAEDGRGARATSPAAGPASRALIRVDDGAAATTGLHTLRILMTAEDADWLHAAPNLMSNDGVGCTVVYNESEVFYDVGLRAKGSQRGRPEAVRLGFGLDFPADQRFRGRLRSALVDRSEGVGFGQREVLLNLVAARAGLVHAEHNDLVHVVAPRATHTGPAELQLDRYTNLVLDAQFDRGADGLLYDYELVYFPYTTEDGSPEGLKLPQPDAVVGAPITDLGDDPEVYRWTFMLQNNEHLDDHGPAVRLAQTFSLPDAAFFAAVEDVIDVDQWLRAFALASLAGAVDNYGGDGAWHNARFYARPSDGRLLYFPHDLDFFGWSEMPVVGNSDLARLLSEPVYARAYYGHLADLLDRAYTPAHLDPWCDQLARLLPAQDFAGHCAFIDARAEWVARGAADSVEAAFPRVDFRITTGGGGEIDADAGRVDLEGLAWVDVRTIERDGEPLPLSWVDGRTWSLSVTVGDGLTPVTLIARDLRGAEVGRDTVTVRVEEE